MKFVEIYTDGACSGNPGPGGWAAILCFNGAEKAISGRVDNTTNNRMELLSVAQALRILKEPCEVKIYSDSAYLIDAFNKGWIRSWQAKGWKTSTKEPVKNQDLWQELLSLSASHQVSWNKVKGHADNAYNNACDALARGEIQSLTKEKKMRGA
ncbi:MAG: ribonuclease HI [Eubacteriales bacterium]|nr:ribonuclease HI [Eubacteriales bacterium]